ncbi:MAG: UDP-N-acetylmuramate dehydrogenase [Candidatus Yonathbacteria bacterium]|nr:UDP-N-acetylmuramate dehydrogenase [Candidatus Yonathbacteria bacterium]
MGIQVKEQVLLAPFTTMRVGGNARFFARVGTVDELSEAVFFARSKNLPIFILGGGSNTLVSGAGFFGLVIKIEFKGITYKNNHITAGAGVVWDEVVSDVVAHNLCGIENLSLIPGTVGGAAVQNIGAYGVEACDTIFSVEAFDMKTTQTKIFLRAECEFGYRESIFKKNKNLVVTRVTFELAQNGTPRADYEDVKNYFAERGIKSPALGEIREAIVAIRTWKMPAPGIGTAGSFFKNPVVSVPEYEALKNELPEIKGYLQADNSVKLSAGWLLDHAGKWRGVRRQGAGVHEKNALILVNYGTATAEEILSLTDEMKSDIKEKTGVLLEEEVILVKS